MSGGDDPNRPLPAKIHRVVLLIVDTDNIGAGEVITILENARYPNHCMSPTVMQIDTRDVGWNDAHPLNNTRTQKAAFETLFADDPT